MTMSAAERQILDRIEISLLASDPGIATRLDMAAVQHSAWRRERVLRRGYRLVLAAGIAGIVGIGVAGAQPVIGALVATGGAGVVLGSARIARRLRRTGPSESPQRRTPPPRG